MEIHLHNPWLTYGIGLHRLREAGLLPEIFGHLDQRPLNLDQLHEFCKIFLIGDDRCIDLPHPRKSSWNEFFGTLKGLIDKEKTQWNPVKKKIMPLIDLDKLQSMHGGRKIFGRRHTTLSYSFNRCQSKESTKIHFRDSTTSNNLYIKSQRISSRKNYPRHRSWNLKARIISINIIPGNLSTAIIRKASLRIYKKSNFVVRWNLKFSTPNVTFGIIPRKHLKMIIQIAPLQAARNMMLCTAKLIV